MIAGRANGKATRRNASMALQPRVLETSRTQTDCSMNAARANK